MKPLILIALLFASAPAALRGHEGLISQQAVISEKQKIELLIRYVETLKHAVFIRNGTVHSPAEAAAHLRYKLGRAGRKISTARTS